MISSTSNEIAAGSVPANSLPDLQNTSPSPGTAYTAPTGGSTSPQAGSDDDLTESYDFTYPNGATDETVQTLTLQLPTAVLERLAQVAELCTPAELGTMPGYTGTSSSGTAGTGWLGNPAGPGCPADSQIGELSGTVTAYEAVASTLGLPISVIPSPVVPLNLSISGNLYLMQPTSPDDVTDIVSEVDVNFGTYVRTVIASGPVDFALNSAGEPELTAALTLPAEAVSPLGGTIPYSLDTLNTTISGLAPSGNPFQIMPSSDDPAIGNTSVDAEYNGNGAGDPAPGTTVPGVTGSGQSTLTPTGAENLAFAPQLATTVTHDASSPIVDFSNTVTAAATAAPSASITLKIPPNLQAYGPNALYEVCQMPDAGFSNCTQVGTVSATTPLLSSPLIGKLYLTGPPLAPFLTIQFPEPFYFSVTGSVDLATNTVTFPTVPDLPLTALTVDVAGGSDGIFETICTTDTSTGAVMGAFVGQNNATATANGAFSIAGCPAPTPPATTTPLALVPPSDIALPPFPAAAPASPSITRADSSSRTVSDPFAVAAGTLRAIGAGARLTLTIANRRGSPAFHVIRLTLPNGARFLTSNFGRNITTAAGLDKVVLSHGQLVITLSGDAVETHIALKPNELALTKSLRLKLRAEKVERLPIQVTLTTVHRTTENVAGILKIT